MRILIAGVDGYLGWPLALHLASKGHELAGIDCYYRREWVREVGSHSATPIASMSDRLAAFSEHYSQPFPFFEGDLTDYEFVEDVFQRFRPEAIVHVGQMPSAPYSMIDVKHAVWTQTNNIVGNRNLIRVSVAWDQRNALPLWGTFTGRATDFSRMDVLVRVDESPCGL